MCCSPADSRTDGADELVSIVRAAFQTNPAKQAF
jgi:hypothetical protein